MTASARERDADAGLDGPASDERPLDLPELYINRELSWLDFNDRVLELAEDEALPLLERVKFLAIFASNLDEFFMIRVSGVMEKIAAHSERRGPDGLAPTEILAAIAEKVRALEDRHCRCWDERVRPALAQEGIRVVSCTESAADPDKLLAHFREQIFPALTPLGIGPGRPFPYISNLSLSLLVRLHDPESDTEAFARVKVPREVLPRFVEIDKDTFIPLEDVIACHLDELFPGMEVISHHYFRVTRDADFDIAEDEGDPLKAVESNLRQRRFGEVVRVEVDSEVEPEICARLADWLGVRDEQIYRLDGLLNLGDLWQIAGVEGHNELRQEPWTPLTHPALRPRGGDSIEDVDVMAAMRQQGDLLLHFPYQSFSSSVERFVAQAVDDPNVLSIKMTVYRTSDDSTLVPSLIAAAERGKQAVCMVELKARFDERHNIRWSRELEEVGAHVTYGLPGLKTHAKLILVARRERGTVRNYVMIGTGNFHAKNAKLYEDFGLFTTDPEIGADAAGVFNGLTGYAHNARHRKVLVAPDDMREPIIAAIGRCEEAARAGQPARIAMKMNALVDRRCIEALYRASRAGVEIKLNIRGICCLRPGVPGVSENIEVTSIVGRFLEHSRIFSFVHGKEKVIYIGSADLMPRNLDARVELLTPVERPELQAELEDTLERCFADDTDSWLLHSDGSWTRRRGGTRSVHRELMERTLAATSAAV